MKKAFFAFLLVSFYAISCYSQQVAIKTNTLYDATLTPNLGLEIATGARQSFQFFYGLNAWNYGSNAKGDIKANHWLVMPEYRWWSCTVMNGWFFGIHAMGGEFNAGNLEPMLPGTFFKGINMQKEVKDTRFEGGFAGGGLTVGYQFILSRHWNLELEAGAGYNYVWYDQFPCAECGTRIQNGNTNYVGLTKAGLVLMYVF